MKKFLLFLSAAVVTVSCNRLKENEYEITGTVDTSLEGKNVFLEAPGSIMGTIARDTVKVEGGKFVFKGTTKEPALNFIQVEGVPGKVEIVLEHGEINIKVDKDSVFKSEQSGTYNNEKLHEYYSKMNKIREKSMALRKANSAAITEAMKTNDPAAISKIMAIFKPVEDEMLNTSKDFIKNNPKAYISMLLMKQQASRGKFTYEELKGMYDALDPELVKTTEGKELHQALEDLKKAKEMEAAMKANEDKVAIGQTAPNFSAPAPDGKEVSLKDAMGKVTLIDFWASWCGPCRQQNPDVVAIYNELHSKGFNIIGVSLDRPGQADKWKKAIADDKLTWTHVSNLMEWKDPIVLQYAVNGIPATFLLDASGKIVAKNLTGDALKAKIKELLAK